MGLEKRQDDKVVKGEVNGIVLSTGTGMDASLIFDYEDETKCTVNAHTKKKKIDFVSGGKHVQFKWNDKNFKFYIFDDTIKKKGKKVKKAMKTSLVIQMLTSGRGMGMVDPEIESVADCMSDYFSLYGSKGETYERRHLLLGNFFNGDTFGKVIDFIVKPKCGLVEYSADMIAIGLTCSEQITKVSVDCYAYGIQPVLGIFSGDENAEQVLERVPKILKDISDKCFDDTAAQKCVDEIEKSCF